MSRPLALVVTFLFALLAIGEAAGAIGTHPNAAKRVAAVATAAPTISESFEGSSTAANAWNVLGAACLTAGTSGTPSTSIPACGAAGAPVDAAGSGALQLTSNGPNLFSRIVATTPLSTANGLQIVFTDYAFNATTTPGADGLLAFFSDASQGMPPAPSAPSGGNLGFVGTVGGYVGIGLDEFGNFSSSDGHGASGNGFPGRIAETVAIRGAYASGNQYVGGYTGTTGKAQSLPFKLDTPTATTRSATAPTVRITLTASGMLTVEIDVHDGNGFTTEYNAAIVGVGSQPAVPANVYLGFAASTGSDAQRHQIANLTVASLASSSPSPSPSPFAPTQISNLAAWYDASDASTLAKTGNAVSSWSDKSGNGNTLVQGTTSAMPIAGANIDGLGALTFNGAQFMNSSNATFSKNVINASTLFVVTSGAVTTTNGSVLSAGAPQPATDPRWELRLYDAGATHFDFNNKNAGRLSSTVKFAGPAVWTAAGSATSQLLRKDGNLLASSAGPGSTESATYPMMLGGNPATNGALSYPYNGSIGEVLIYNRFLTTSETQVVEGYLACKWGMQNRLPENHPYRSACPASVAVAAPIPTASPNPASSAIPIVPELRSANGKLSVTVVAQQDAAGNPHLTYNGSYIPPTLRLLPGDTLAVTLINQLPTPPAGAAYLNDTNLHFHGLHVSPNAPADDSIDMLALPGQTLNYSIPIPANHPTGLYWYHSHAHGEAERQNLSGMSGALVIDGIASYMPSVANMPERILIARDVLPAGQALPSADRRQVAAMGWAMLHNKSHYGMPMKMDGSHATMTMGEGAAVRSNSSVASRNPYVITDPRYKHFDRHRYDASDGHCVGTETPAKLFTLNSVSNPSIGIRPGEQQFWRLVNAGSDTYLDVAVDNATLQIIAIDGVPIGSGIGTPQTLPVNDYVVPPAGRVEFIVTGPAAGTTSYLRTKCFDAGAAGPAMPAMTLASLDPTSSLADYARTKQRISPKAIPYHFPRFARVAVRTNGKRRMYNTGPIARTQTLYYSDQNTINGVAYDPGAAPQFYAQSGTFEEWTIVNNSSQVHTFHIHQIHFVVEAINGISQSQEFEMDNVNVPAATSSGPGSVKILLDFTDPLIIGTFLLHCHILAHEDGGMMAKIRVGTAAPMTVNSSTLSFANPTAAAQKVTVSGGTTPYSVSGCAGVANGVISGTSLTVSPTGAGSCVFTISDTTGLSTTVSVNVGASASALTVSPTSLSFASASAAAQNATVSGGASPYAVSGCSGIATAAINSTENGVSVAPVAAGSCSLTISDANSNTVTLAVSVNAASTGGPQDNVTFHHDNGRTGWYPNETILNTTNVAGGTFALLNTLSAPSGMPAFGKVYAQPLYVQNQATSDGKTHNLIVIATTTDQLYAFDETTHAVVWEHNFTNASAGITQQLATDTGCGDVNPNTGIVGTPVIDRSMNRLYVVVPTDESGTAHLRLHAISMNSGADAISPVEVTATLPLASGGTAATSAANNFDRGGLLEANGNIYVPLSSHCDYHGGGTHGWLLAYSASTLATTGNALDTTASNNGSNFFLGSIWMSGFGPAADSSGNVYFVTGNGPYDGVNDFGMSAIRVPGNLDITKSSSFTPSGEAADSNADSDLGSGGVLLLPDNTGTYPHLMLLGGKCGVGTAKGGTAGCQKYLLNRDSLGGFTSTDSGALWHNNTAGGMWGGPAAFIDATGAIHVVYGTGNPIGTYTLGLSPVQLSTQSQFLVGCLECRNLGSQPVVSSNGTAAGSAVVWALKTPTASGGTISLYAFDALNMTHTLFSAAAGTWTIGSGFDYIGGALVSPTVANGRVYVPTDGAVAVFGLNP